jgi:hypothetical protein
MSLGKKIFHQNPATGGADAAQGLVIHLDANDEDSIESGGANTGAGSGTWFDIANHDLNVPLVDKASNLKLHLNASDTTSYSGSGDWKDISGSGIDGTISGATFESDTRGYFHFDGSNDVVTLSATDTSPINLSSETHTIEFWVNFDNLSNDDVIVGKFGGSNTLKSFQIQVSSTNKLTVLERDGSSNNTFETTGTFSTGAWTHFAYTRSASNVKLYINGTLDVNHSASNAINAGSTQDITIGNQAGASVFFDGRMSVLRIYNTTLTDSEVAQNFRADCFLSYSSIYSTNLKLHLDAGDDTTVSASTWSDKANSNDVTLSGFSSTLSDFYDKELGNWLNFDGSDDTGDISHHSDLDTSTTFTVEAWVQRNDDTERYILVKQGGSGSYGYSLQFHPNSSLGYYFVVYNTANSLFSVAATVAGSGTAGLWQHVVGVIDGTNIYLYINGNRVDNSTYSGTLADSDSVNLFLGRYPAGATRWLGKIGQARIYQSALSATEVGQNYLVGKRDYPNGFNGTISGAVFGTNGGSPNEKYFDFSGATSHLITIPDNDLFDMQANSSMEIWLTKSSGTAHIINKKGGGTESWSLWTNGTLIYFYAYNSGGSGATTALQTSSTLNATWNHIIVTVDDALDYEIYLNGSSEATDTSLSNRLINSDTVKIGSYSGSNAYAGKVAMLKFHAKELSSSEVTANYNATKATFGIS